MFGLVVLSFVSSYADQNITSCGAVITTVDNYFLNQSINTSSGTCIEFQAGASGSTLNCQGFSINNTGSASIGVRILSSNFVIEHCNINYFTTNLVTSGNSNNVNNISSIGVFLGNTLQVTGNSNVIENSTFTDGFIILQGNNASFLYNQVYDLDFFFRSSISGNDIVANSLFSNVSVYFQNTLNNTFENISGFYNVSFTNSYYNQLKNISNVEVVFQTMSQNNTFSASSINNISSFNWSQTPNFFENNSYAQDIVNSSGCIIAAQPEVICDTGSWSVFSPVVVSTSSTASLFPQNSLFSIIITLALLFFWS